jgi:hypothetical protein
VIRILFFILILSLAFAVPPPELPGVEVTDSETALEQGKKLVQKQSYDSIYQHKGWTAPDLEEQLNQDEMSIGMEQGAIFIPRFTQSHLEPEYTAIKTDTLSKEYMGREWIGKHGIKLIVPYGSYTVIMGSGSIDKKTEYKVEVKEGKITVIPPDWGGLVINTVNENGEYVSENYEIFSVYNGESYGKGFGLTHERLNDVKTWILPPQVYRISRSGENASSIVNYITVQVNPGELSYVELVFEESTGRLIAGGVSKMQINTSKNSYWAYGLRFGGSANYTTLLTGKGQKSDNWNTLGDIRLRMLYNPSKLFWLTQIYLRENMQWLNEDNKESQWSVALDLLQFQSSVVYKFFEWIGVYTRTNAKTHIFPEYHQMESDEKIRNPPFDPLRVGEGIGLNLRPIGTNTVDISAQTGIAARQTIRRNIIVRNANERSQILPTSGNIYDYGWENSLHISFYFRLVTLDLAGEVFLPSARVKDYIVEELSADLRIAITRFLEFAYHQQINDLMVEGLDKAKSERFESLNTFQLRLYVNF